MEIPSKYAPENVESKWYDYWMKQNIFHSEPDEREPFTIVIPPPNVTGVLHMGHMLNNTIQDILIRRARMTGYNACWVPGTDHASIATEAKVVGRLAEQGIKKTDLSREEFLNKAWEWKEEHGGIILKQLRKLGASCDWDRTAFTMDPALSESVIKVFVDLYEKDLIYRGVRMVNWDPKAKTAVSDEEVIYKEEKSKLYYLRYKIEDEDDYVTIATTRPETILGDTAVCVNPNDDRFRHLHGKKVIVPLVNRAVPIITDEYVDMEFGTGCLKITPAHDINDYEIGLRKNLEVIDIFNDDGTLSKTAQLFVGKDRFDVRKEIIPELEAAGSVVKIEDYSNKIGYSERTNVVIEPKLSAQWFLKMKDLAEPALENVMNDTVEFFPKKFKNVYRHWMENIKDWCVSRQLWWGQRIPVYYLPNGEYVAAVTADEALEKAIQKSGDSSLKIEDLKQDEDVLDTWASSWLWPISVFDGINNPDNKEINYYYPTSTLVTGHDIIFFWVARMIMTGYEYRQTYPFKHVYFTGMVRDKQGRKMSKSLGNSPDPIELIEKFGADGVRVGMLLCSPAGGDLLFDESLTEQGRNFANKIWNAFRLIKSWKVDEGLEQPKHSEVAIDWFKNKLNQQLEILEQQYADYRLSEGLMTLYRLFWDDFSSWLLEIVKPEYQKGIDPETLQEVTGLFEKLMQQLHPFMPFITEEIWQLAAERKDGESISILQVDKNYVYNQNTINEFEDTKEVITAIRSIRQDKQIPMKETLKLTISGDISAHEHHFDSVIHKMANISNIVDGATSSENATKFMVKTTEYAIPLGDLIDVEAEITKLQEELKYYEGFLVSVNKKLSNERFVNNAPEKVVESERKKQADAEAKIKTIQESLKSMAKS